MTVVCRFFLLAPLVAIATHPSAVLQPMPEPQVALETHASAHAAAQAWSMGLQRAKLLDGSRVVYINKFSEDDSLQDIFDKLDTDKNKFVSIQEIEGGELPFKVSAVMKTAHQHDANMDGHLSFLEFSAAHSAFFADAPQTELANFVNRVQSDADAKAAAYAAQQQAVAEAAAAAAAAAEAAAAAAASQNAALVDGATDDADSPMRLLIKNSQNAKQLFALVDANGDGFLDSTELTTFASSHQHLRRFAAEVEQDFATYDTDGDGKLSFDEFQAAYDAWMSKHPEHKGTAPKVCHHGNTNGGKGILPPCFDKNGNPGGGSSLIEEGSAASAAVAAKLRQRRLAARAKGPYGDAEGMENDNKQPVMANAQIIGIWWGSQTPWYHQVDNWFTQNCINSTGGYSTYFEGLPEYYGYFSGAQTSPTPYCSYFGSIVDVNQNSNTPTNIYDSDAQAWLGNLLKGKLSSAQPSLTPQLSRIYNMFFPSQSTYQGGGNLGPSCVAWCAFHSVWAGATQGADKLYAIIPTCPGCQMDTNFNNLMIAVSHENVEAMSDPLLGAWRAANDQFEEIGDICAWQLAYVQGNDMKPYPVQRYYIAESATCMAGCFPGDALVQTATREWVRMSDLRVGTEILSRNAAGEEEVSAVYTFLDRIPEAKARFVHISHDKGSLSISPMHLLYRYAADQSLEAVYAKTIRVGDFINVDGAKAEVDGVSAREAEGWYAPVTMNGNLVVDGVMTSAYSVISDHTFAHWSMAPLRWFADYLPNNERGVHWYAQWLRETVVERVMKPTMPHVVDYLFPELTTVA